VRRAMLAMAPRRATIPVRIELEDQADIPVLHVSGASEAPGPIRSGQKMLNIVAEVND
jgi:hypothetical protein